MMDRDTHRNRYSEMDLLERYLSAQLISAQSDEELAKIESAVSRFSKVVAHRPSRFIAALYAAVVPEAPASSGVLDEVHEVLREEWRTLASRYPGKPTELLRVICLCSLVSLATQEEYWADALGMLLPSVEPLVDRGADDAEIWQALVAEFQAKFEGRAEAEWAVPSSVDLPDLQLSEDAARSFTFTGGSINKDKLNTLILSAFVNTDPTTNEQLQDGNPNSPQQHPQWGNHAGQRLGSVLAGPMAKALQGTIEAPDTTALASQIAEYVQDALQALSSAVHGQDLRTRLIWWRESGYSPGSQRAYSSMSPEAVAIQTAIDMARWLPNRTPPSAFYFLRNSVRTFLSHSDDQITLATYRDTALELDLSLDRFANEVGTDVATLFEVLDSGSIADCSRTVFQETTRMSPEDVAVHLLREILASRILGEIKPGRKPKGH